LLTGAMKMARQLEKFVRPRLAFLHAGPGMLRLIGLGIVIAGLGLMLPLPIPFSNSIPALAVVLLAIGMLEKDGLCVLLGSFNCSSYLGFYRSDLCVRHRRFPEAFGFFSGFMRLDFITALTTPTPVSHIPTAMWCLPWLRNTLPPFYKLGYHEILLLFARIPAPHFEAASLGSIRRRVNL